MRAGAQALSTLVPPLTGLILPALAERSLPPAELRRAVGSPAAATLRRRVRALRADGLLADRRDPGGGAVALTGRGRALLPVARHLEHWLAAAPREPLALGGEPAGAAIRALVAGWESTLLGELAGRPLTLTQLDIEIPEVSYPALERRLSALRAVGLVEPRPGPGRRVPHAVSSWARSAVGPLAVAARFEDAWMGGEAAPVTRVETEAAFLLSLPLVSLPLSARGSCALAVGTGGEERVAGVRAEVERGRVAAVEPGLESRLATLALGTPAAWFEAVIDDRADRLRLRGDSRLALSLVRGLHEALFG